jgi:uncharacterized DUF497 family protein
MIEFDDFDWDDGNRDKCLKHGLSVLQVEEFFRQRPNIRPDIDHSSTEDRYLAIGPGRDGKRIFAVFTVRMRDGLVLARPISVRYMHIREIKRYEKENPEISN